MIQKGYISAAKPWSYHSTTLTSVRSIEDSAATVLYPENDCALPLVVWLPGSDFRGDDLNKQEDPVCPFAPLAALGYVVLHVHHEREVGNPFRISFEHCEALLEWICSGGCGIKIAATNVYLAGFGLGGTLAHLLPRWLRENRPSPTCQIRITAIISMMAPCRFYTPPWGETASSLFGAIWPVPPHPGRCLLGLAQPPWNKAGIEYSPEYTFETDHPPTLFIQCSATLLDFPVRYLPFAHALAAKNRYFEFAFIPEGGNSGRSLPDVHIVVSFFKRCEASSMHRPLGSALVWDSKTRVWLETKLRFSTLVPHLLSFEQPVDPLSHTPTGGLEHRVFSSQRDGLEMSALVYLPPSYTRQPLKRFPLIVFMLAHVQSPRQFAPYYLAAIDLSSRAGDLPEAIYLFPNHRDRGELGKVSNMRADLLAAVGARPACDRIILDEMLPWIDANYRTIAKPDFRTILGDCSSARLAIHLGLNARQHFRYIDINAPRFHWSVKLAAKIRRKGAFPFISILQGQADHFGASGTSALIGALKRRGIAFGLNHVARGGHGYMETARFAENTDVFNYHRRWEALQLRASVDTTGSIEVRQLAVGPGPGVELLVPKSGPTLAPVVVYFANSNYLSDFWQAPGRGGSFPRALCMAGFVVAVIQHSPLSARGGQAIVSESIDALGTVETWMTVNTECQDLLFAGSGGGALVAALLCCSVATRLCERPETLLALRKRIRGLFLCSCPSDLELLDYMNWREGSMGCHQQAREGSSLKRFFGTDQSTKVSLSDAAWLAQHFEPHIPVQLVHGFEDSVVSSRQSVRFCRSLRDRGVRTGLKLLHHGHGDNSAAIWNEAARFFHTENHDPLPKDDPATTIPTLLGSAGFQQTVDPYNPFTPGLERIIIESDKSSMEATFSALVKRGTTEAADVVYLLGSPNESGKDYLLYFAYIEEARKAKQSPDSAVVFIHPGAIFKNADEKQIERVKGFVAMVSRIESKLQFRPSRRILEGFDDGGFLSLAAMQLSEGLFAKASVNLFNEPQASLSAIPFNCYSAPPLKESIRITLCEDLICAPAIRTEFENSPASIVEVSRQPDPLLYFLEQRENPFWFYFADPLYRHTHPELN